jgi:pyruvate dehydrogenase E2 component (dihydrolipoamide acetyltransferase)
MPMLGLTMTEGAIRKWWKQEGDPVQRGVPLFEVETDKALVDVEAPDDGLLLRVLVGAEQVVPVGTIVGVIGADREDVTAILAQAVTAPPTGAGADLRPRVDAPKPAGPSGPKLISPRARKLAEEHNIDWKGLQGTGPDGQVTEKEVQLRIAHPSTKPPRAGAAADVVQPLSKTRQIIAERLTRSLHERAHIYLTLPVEMHAALDFCNQRPADSGTPFGSSSLSVNDLIVKAVAICLSEYPWVNSTLVEKEVHLHSSVNIGFAVSAKDGTLVVPVLRGVERLSLAEIANTRGLLVQKATNRRLTPDDMLGSTFTISNLGMYGVEQFTAIINPPETGILAVGAITEEPRVIQGGLFVRPTMRVTLGVDHRVVDGAQAAQFLCRFKTLLEQPRLLTASKEGK